MKSNILHANKKKQNRFLFNVAIKTGIKDKKHLCPSVDYFVLGTGRLDINKLK